MKPAYKEGTTAFYIIQDGWSRGFEIEQTHQELAAQGYHIDLESVHKFFVLFDEWMENGMKLKELEDEEEDNPLDELMHLHDKDIPAAGFGMDEF
jgi:hypothetical protein